MPNNDILKDYEVFLMENVQNKTHSVTDYCLLLDILFNIPFKSHIDMDNNRIEDAYYMRKEYLSDDIFRRIDGSIIKDRYISVFEVLFALSKRMENDILCDPMEEIDHSADHFWLFLRNLGVEKYSNGRINEAEIRYKVEKWVNRDYEKDGTGSIFPVKGSKIDMRKVEIWQQMSIYIMENY